MLDGGDLGGLERIDPLEEFGVVSGGFKINREEGRLE